MAKNTTIGVRVDEELKDEAQQVFEKLGLPMSFGIEMFLRDVIAKEKLPFSLSMDDSGDSERKKREHDFWKNFIIWYFRVWPRFDAAGYAEEAQAKFNFNGRQPGDLASDYILGDTGGFPDKMTSQQSEAYADLRELSCLLGEAKELIYWALDMEKTFVPSLSSEYSGKADKWRYDYLKSVAKDGISEDNAIAHGVVGARYFGTDI